MMVINNSNKSYKSAQDLNYATNSTTRGSKVTAGARSQVKALLFSSECKILKQPKVVMKVSKGGINKEKNIQWENWRQIRR